MPYIKDFSKEYISKEKIKPRKKLLSQREEYKLKKDTMKHYYTVKDSTGHVMRTFPTYQQASQHL